jgi:hypothetical protein
LDAQGGDRDDSSTEVGPAETLKVCSTLGLGLDLIKGFVDGGKTLLTLFTLASEAGERLESTILLALGDEPPGRSGS